MVQEHCGGKPSTDFPPIPAMKQAAGEFHRKEEILAAEISPALRMI